MQHQEGYFQSKDGLQLYGQSWLPVQPVQAHLMVIHGYGEHSGRYAHVADALNVSGIAVHGIDLRGHGRSEGKRGDTPSWSTLLEDIRMYMDILRRRYESGNLFLYGHSVGGLVAIDYALHVEQDFRGLIASGPVLGQAGVSPFLLFLSKILASVVPGFQLDVNLDVDNLSRDPAVVEAYCSDPLVHGKATARMGAAMNAATEACQRDAKLLRIPFLVFYGEEDKLAPPGGTEQFYANLHTEDRTKHVIAGGYHEPHNDVGKEEILSLIQTWITGRL